MFLAPSIYHSRFSNSHAVAPTPTSDTVARVNKIATNVLGDDHVTVTPENLLAISSDEALPRGATGWIFKHRSAGIREAAASPGVTYTQYLYHSERPLGKARTTHNQEEASAELEALDTGEISDEALVGGGVKPWRFLKPQIDDNSLQVGIQHLGDPSGFIVHENIGIHLIMSDDYRRAEHFAVQEFTATPPTLYSEFEKLDLSSLSQNV